MLVPDILFKTFQALGSHGGTILNTLTRTSERELPPITDEILIIPVPALAEKIRKRQLSSERVVKAFIERTKLVQHYLNAIVDERFEDAIKEAKAIDEFLKTCTMSEAQLASLKPLLGVPFTTKDSIQVAGMKWSSGCLRRKDIIGSEDAPVIRNYKRAGAIPIALTNVPELLLWFATSNKLYGTTNNPFDLSRTPGGSSGGEAALMSSGGSPLSISSDIGGSIRMPAFHCGLFGHKPTHGIIDWHGTFPTITENLKSIFTFGPIARYAEELPLALRVMAAENYHQFKDIEKPVELSKIKFYYVDECDNSLAAPVASYISKSIREAAEYFASKHGCSMQKANFRHLKHVPLWYTILFSNNQDVASLITENTYKINPFYELCKSALGQSEFSPSALTVAAAQEATKSAFSHESAPLVHEKARNSLDMAQKEFQDLLGDDGVLLCATLPRTAPTHYAALFEFNNICYPMLMNYLNAPTTAVPMGTHSGLPFGIQVSATAYNDRLTLAVAKELERAFGGWIKPVDVQLDTDQKPNPSQ